MDFTIDVKSEAGKKALIEGAESNERGAWKNIPTSGAYVVSLESVYTKSFPTSGSGSIHFDVKTEDDENANFDLFVLSGKTGNHTYVKNGKAYDLPGVSQIKSGLMVVLKQANLKPIPGSINGTNTTIYKSIEGKKIGVVLQMKKIRGKKDPNKIYNTYELVTFFDPETRKTGSELLTGKEATKVDAIIADLIDIDETGALTVQKDDDAFSSNKTESKDEQNKNDAYEEFFDKSNNSNDDMPF